MYKTFLWPKFKPYTREINASFCSCGGTAASILTGIPTKEISSLHPDNEDWSHQWMARFLKKKGFRVKKIPYDFYNHRKGFSRIFYPEHVILAVVFVDKEQCTWCVINQNKIYHVQNLFRGFKGLEVLINFPMVTSYLVAPKKRAARIRVR